MFKISDKTKRTTQSICSHKIFTHTIKILKPQIKYLFSIRQGENNKKYEKYNYYYIYIQ